VTCPGCGGALQADRALGCVPGDCARRAELPLWRRVFTRRRVLQAGAVAPVAAAGAVYGIRTEREELEKLPELGTFAARDSLTTAEFRDALETMLRELHRLRAQG
jgi:hypothetical protein